MKVQMTPIIIDDDHNECRIDDTILIRTKKIPDLTPAKITHISTTFVTLLFDDPFIGYQPLNLRIREILECKIYN